MNQTFEGWVEHVKIMTFKSRLNADTEHGTDELSSRQDVILIGPSCKKLLNFAIVDFELFELSFDQKHKPVDK